LFVDIGTSRKLTLNRSSEPFGASGCDAQSIYHEPVPPRFRILLPAHLTGFAVDLEFGSTSRAWTKVKEGDGGWRSGEVIRVPDQLFEEARRVEDEKAYRIVSDCMLECERGEPEPGGVALLLESAHKEEFDGQGGAAIGPLRNKQAGKSLEAHLPRLLREVEQLVDRTFEGEALNLVNVVQYQTSLQSLMTEFEGPLQSGVRTPVWGQLFRNGGAGNMLDRLDLYKPAVVLVAPTGEVRRAVNKAIGGHQNSWPWIDVDCHPSYWTRRFPALGSQLYRASAAS
jgi:hypothetical protein